MKYLSALSFCAILSTTSLAQTSQIRGHVTDAQNGKPITNAVIWASGTQEASTDKNGDFMISCKENVELTISFIGYEPVTQKVSCNDVIKVALQLTSKNLNEVEITATSNPNKAMLYQPASIGRMSEAEIKRGTGLLMDDAINTNIPGVIMERRTFSAGQQLNIRGYGNGTRGTNGINSNFDGQGYKVYLNGIPITDAEGITLMDDIDFGSVGNVEVVKGPSGTLYGQAIAGVVNLKTIQPEPGTSSIGQEAILGSYGLQRYTTTLQLSKEKSSIRLNYGKQKYDGFAPHTASNKDFVNFFGTFTPNARQTINSYFGYSHSYDERNGELTIAQFDTLDYSGNPFYVKNNAHSEVTSFRTGVSHDYKFSDQLSNTTTVFGTGLISNVSSAGGWTDKSAVNYGLRSTFNTKFALGTRFTLSGITGIEAQMQNAQTLGYPMVADSFNLSGYNIPGALRSNQYTISKTLSLFTEWTLTMPNDLALTAGIGYSTLGIELNDRMYVATNNNPSNPKGTHNPNRFTNTFNNMVSPHLAINKVFAKEISAYASFSTGYKAPTSSYFFIPLTGQINTNIQPEFATQFEVGTKGTLFNDRLNYQLAGFYTQYTNKMTTVAVPNASNTATSYTYAVNGGKQNNLGIELALRGVAYQSKGFLRSINPFANLAYSNFKYGNFQYQTLSSDKKSAVVVDYSNNVVVGVPPIVANLGFDLNTAPGFYANMTYSYRDKMYFTSDNLNQTNTYHLLNAKVGYTHVFVKHIGIDVYAGLNNITQNKNYAMVFLNQIPDAYIPAPNKINGFGGLSVKYIF
ncbi:MAG: TonB-dependent receptor [Bacteroidetes bacterium]|nr:TonB-dependent receptor [Bacteroidota bacterium]